MKESKGEERESGGRSERKKHIKNTKYKIIIIVYIYIVTVVKM